jgi:1-acyl-sn-glycerol-3-phosphate acyltransferase
MQEPRGWTRGVKLMERVLGARKRQPNFARVAKRAVRRIYEEKLLDDETLARIEALGKQDTLSSFGYDPFGFNPDFLIWVVPVMSWIHRRYFRVESFGIDNIPDGPVLLIANHSGQLPIDAMMIVMSMILDKSEPRPVRSMVERWVPTLPIVSWFFARAGQIVGTRDNFRRLVAQGEAILVFPEGVRGISKTYDKAYQLQGFGLGFMRLALENNLPIVPIGVVGAEEQAPSLYDFKALGKMLGMPAFPITPTFPLMGPAGLLPYPTKYRIYFGEPLYFEGNPDDEDRVIGEKVERVKSAITSMLQRGLRERKSIFF